MKNKNILVCFLVLFVNAFGCNNENQIEKFQNQRDNIISVENKINDIKIDIIFGPSFLYIVNNYLIISELAPRFDKGIHLIDKNTFEYITSTGIVGKGPGEVARQGRIGVESKNNFLWISDYGKNVIWKFPIDSVLNNKKFKPSEKINLNNKLFIERYGFLNDSIALGKAVRVLSHNSFDMAMVKFNLNTKVTEMYGYEHPEAVGKLSNSQFKLSVKDSFYVNCYAFIDLMTICSLDGKLKYNVYGPGGMKNKNGKKSYYKGIDIFDKYIITSYNGNARLIYDEYKRLQGNNPSKFLIFDLEGNYVKTIETKYKFSAFCVDEVNKRLIAYFDDREKPLGYIDLKEILK